MCNLPEMPSVAQGLDGGPSGGEPVFPRIHKLAATVSDRKVSWFVLLSISGGANLPTHAHARSDHAAA